MEWEGCKGKGIWCWGDGMRGIWLGRDVEGEGYGVGGKEGEGYAVGGMER